MEDLFYIREEIICLVILIFLLCYSVIYARDKGKTFYKVCIPAIFHVLMDSISLYTVNQPSFPEEVNYVVNVLYLVSAVFFSCSFCHYVGGLIFTGKWKTWSIWSDNIIFFIYCVGLFFFKLEFEHSNYSWYASGPMVIWSYLAAGMYFSSSFFTIIFKLRSLSKKIKYTLFPLSSVTILFLVIQYIYPDFLFTGADATIISISVFFAIENPAGRLQQKAFFDVATGLKNKNGYENDILQIYEKQENEPDLIKKIHCIVCDVNDLKKVNDTWGHMVGDELIATAAKVLKRTLRSANDVYRTGGDEFIAVYFGEEQGNFAKKEMENIGEKCEYISQSSKFKLSISCGYATYEDGDTDIMNIINRADAKMYENKRRYKGIK